MPRALTRTRLGGLAWRAALALVALAVCLGCGRTLRLAFDPLRVQASPPAPPAPPPPPPPPAKTEQIHITERVEFETDKATLLPSSHKVLDQVVAVMKKNPDILLIEIQGHTDNTGTDEYNLRLSDDRAKAVRHYLIEKGGIDAGRVQFKGYGRTVPLASNDSEQGKQKNRRVEFHILRRGPKAADK